MGTSNNQPRRILRLLAWSLTVVICTSLVVFIFRGVSILNRRKAIMADAMNTFGWRAMETEGHYPSWPRSWIGADTYPNGWGTVTGIHLEGTDIGDDELAGVAAQMIRFPDVWALSLDGTNISDAGLEHLKQLSHLQFISLKDTSVTDTGVAELRSAMPKTKIVK